MTFESIKKDINAGKFKPVYYFFGEEPYFTDKLTKLLEKKVLNPGEETFNKTVVYGPEFKAGKVMSDLRSFPMMATRRLVMVKEAQRVRKEEWDKLEAYLNNPVDSTIFVVAFKGKNKKLDGRSKVTKLIKKHGVVFESKSLYDNQVPPLVTEIATGKGFTIDQDALRVLCAYLGTNLGLIESEMQKIFLYMEGMPEKRITLPIVYEMINVDKDFNVFELLNYLGAREHAKCHFIINQMMKNVKDNPPIMIISQIFGFFNRIGICQAKKLSNEIEVAQELGLHKFVARQYLSALRNYSMQDIRRNLTYILEADLQLKGIQHTHLGNEHVMKMLIFKLLN